MSLKDEIARAVSAAVTYDPKQPNLQRDAYSYLEQLKGQHAGESTVWQSCLEIFLAGDGGSGSGSGAWTYAYQPEARMFGLQVVDEMLESRFGTVEPQHLQAVQQALLDYVKREYVLGDAEGSLFYLRNKLVHTLFLVFMQTYTSSWTDFFDAFISLLPNNATASTSEDPYNPKTTDLFLRLLHEISTEISDTTLRLNKAHARLTRDTELRDAVRAKDARSIVEQTSRILQYALSRTETPSSNLSSKQAAEIAEMAMRVLADHASWIDVSFIVTPDFLPLLFQGFTTPQVPIRLASGELLYELVTKGMPPADKLELLRVLNVSQAITQLLDSDDARRTASNGTNGHGANSNTDQLELFREKLARILNGMGLELTRIAEEASASDEQKAAALSATLEQRSLALRFLADEYDDTSSTVIPFFSAILVIYKKEKKRAAQTHLTPEKAEFLNKLLEVTIRKMRYSNEEEWGGEDDASEDGQDEAVVAFLDFRRNLKTIFDAVAAVDFDLFATDVKGLITRTLDSVDSGSSDLEWMDVEVALFVLYSYGEPAQKEKGTSGPAAFVQVPPDEIKRSRNSPDHNIDFNKYAPSVLGEIMLRTMQSNVSSWPHASVPVQLFECVSRYHDFFQLVPDTIMRILPAFLDQRGMHQENQAIRCRCFYLFNRFVFTSRMQLQQHLSPGNVASICSSVQDLLTIEASVPEPESPGDDVLTKAARKGSFFDSQLYLFEALGTLMSTLGNHQAEQVGLLRALLQPLLSDIAAAASASDSDPEQLLRLHHLIKAVGNVAHGFPEIKSATHTPSGEWIEVFREAMRVILDTLKVKNTVLIIREASLGTFKSIVARITQAALPLVAPLIDSLVEHLTASEVVDFLPFIGMLVHRYKATFAEMLDVLLIPVFDRTYHFLEQPITGTDDIQQHSELRRAYFTLLLSISTAGMQSVYFSSRNAPRLDSLLNSIPHYLSNGALLQDQKVGFGVVVRMTSEWVKPLQSTEPSVLPEFKDFIYQRLVPLAMELPVRVNFDYSDAAAYQVIGEIALLFKALQTLRGDEFGAVLSQVFAGLGMPNELQQEFLSSLAQSADGKVFKKWLAPFFQKAKQTSNDKPYSVAHLLVAVPSSGQR